MRLKLALISKDRKPWSIKIDDYHENMYVILKKYFPETLNTKYLNYSPDNFTLFSFSTIKAPANKYTYNEQTGKLTINDIAEIYISSPINEFILEIAKNIQKDTNFHLFGVKCDILNFYEVSFPFITKENGCVCIPHSEAIRIPIITLSPIVVYELDNNFNKQYISPSNQEAFNKLIAEHLQEKYNILNNGELDLQDFFIEPTRVSPEDTPLFTHREILFLNEYIKSNKGTFALTGKLEALKFAYDTGIGFFCNYGFGLWEVLDESKFKELPKATD